MTISEKIFELISQKGMTQKEFAERTGIAPSAVSDWKRKKTNPVSEKILIICDVLGVTPYELLSATEDEGRRSRPADLYVIEKGTEPGRLIEVYQQMDDKSKGRLWGYIEALQMMKD
jgi:transcriptional regulator with XRE-family HTH domain